MVQYIEIFISFKIQNLVEAWRNGDHCVSRICDCSQDLRGSNINKISAKMNSQQTVLLSSVIFTFVALACFMIWWTPKGSLMQQEYNLLHKGKEENSSEINVGPSTQVEDEFLDSLSYRWEIVVVNAGKDQLESCRRCQVVEESWTGKFFQLK